MRECIAWFFSWNYIAYKRVAEMARARNAPAVLVADHRPILPRDGVVGAQVAQCVVRIVVVMPVLVTVVPAPAL